MEETSLSNVVLSLMDYIRCSVNEWRKLKFVEDTWETAVEGEASGEWEKDLFECESEDGNFGIKKESTFLFVQTKMFTSILF